jgi:hypothetical protein
MHRPLLRPSRTALAIRCCKFVALGVLVGALCFYTSRALPRGGQTRVVAAEQPGSPLLVVPAFVDSSNPLRPQYTYFLTNLSEKPIRAYTIQESVSLDAGAPIIGATMSHLLAVKLFLMPGATKQEEGGLGATYETSPVKIELAVDFVEFADGTRWGADANNSGDRLDGMRAGGKAAAKKYREILDAKGVIALEQALAASDLMRPGSQSKSQAWAEGFNTGVNTVKSRLVKAKTEKGLEELRHELNRPFDSTDGRQEP